MNAESIRIAPYLEINGIRTFQDSYVMALYDRMASQGLVKRVFFSGDITSREAFLARMKHPAWLFVATAMEGFLPVGDPAGMVWLDGFGHGTAFVHFCAFRPYFGQPARDLARKALEKIGAMQNPDGSRLFHALYGKTPANNRAALRFVREVGMTPCGTYPGYFFDVYQNRRVDAVLTSHVFGG